MGKFVYKKRDSAQVDATLQLLRSGGSSQPFLSKYTVWKPKDGLNTIRILPPTWEDAGHYGIIIALHYFVGPEKNTYVCPKKLNRTPCPLCERSEMLKAAGKKKEGETLEPRSRSLVWLLDRKEEMKGPQLWAMPMSKVDAAILLASKNKRTGNTYPIDDPEEGFDIFLTKSGQNMNTEYFPEIDRETSPVDQKWVDFVVEHPLPSVLNVLDYDVIKRDIDGIAPESFTVDEAHEDGHETDVKSELIDEAPPQETIKREKRKKNRLDTLKDMPLRKLYRLAEEFGVEISETIEDTEIPEFMDKHLPDDAEI